MVTNPPWCCFKRAINGRATPPEFVSALRSSKVWRLPAAWTLTLWALLVMTQDGRVARQLIGEDADMEKEYLVRVTCAGPQGDIAVNVQAHFPAAQMQRLRHGLSLDGKPLKPAQVEWQNPEQLRFVLKEGKKRQIRRMCEQVGLKVVGLKRIRMGRISLGALPVGQWRYLGPKESFLTLLLP
jgi:23S rRNA pseudouridine2604 synthase